MSSSASSRRSLIVGVLPALRFSAVLQLQLVPRAEPVCGRSPIRRASWRRARRSRSSATAAATSAGIIARRQGQRQRRIRRRCRSPSCPPFGSVAPARPRRADGAGSGRDGRAVGARRSRRRRCRRGSPATGSAASRPIRSAHDGASGTSSGRPRPVRWRFPTPAGAGFAVVVDLPWTTRSAPTAARHRRRDEGRHGVDQRRVDEPGREADRGPDAAPPDVDSAQAGGLQQPAVPARVPRLETRASSGTLILSTQLSVGELYRAHFVGAGPAAAAASARRCCSSSSSSAGCSSSSRSMALGDRSRAGASRSPARCTSCSPAPSVCVMATSRTRSP